MQTQNHGVDLLREHFDQKGDEWMFGGLSQPCLYSVPLEKRKDYLPNGEYQRGKEDFQDCVTRGYLNALEIKFTYAYRNDIIKPENKVWLFNQGYVVFRDGLPYVEFSDRYIAIKSGTTKRGNSMKAPVDTIRKIGLIPKEMFKLEGEWMTWEQYHDSSKLTKAMDTLANEFKLRFRLNYEQVLMTHLEEAIKDDIPNVAGHGWEKPRKGEYQKTDKPITHAFILFDLPLSYAFDNYPETESDRRKWVKKLAKDFVFYEHGYRIFVSSEVTASEFKKQVSLIQKAIDALAELVRAMFPKPAYDQDPKELPMNQPTNQEKLYAAAVAALGKDISPLDRAPDELGCMESLSMVLRQVVDFPIITGTWTGLDYIRKSPLFKKVDAPEAGDIIICATIPGKPFPAHAGVVGKKGAIMSNSSKTGKWEENYTLATWDERYRKKGGYVVHYFRLK